MLTDYFDKAMAILATADNHQNTPKDYAMALLYGLNTVDSNCPADMKARLDKVYADQMSKYSISDQNFEDFKRSNLNAPSDKKLPKSGCN